MIIFITAVYYYAAGADQLLSDRQ